MSLRFVGNDCNTVPLFSTVKSCNEDHVLRFTASSSRISSSNKSCATAMLNSSGKFMAKVSPTPLLTDTSVP